MSEYVPGLNREARAYVRGYDIGREGVTLDRLSLEGVEPECRRAFLMGYEDGATRLPNTYWIALERAQRRAS